MDNNDLSLPPDPMDSTMIRPDSIKLSSILQLSNNLSQYILLHPLVALRRTCQVNRKCSPFICIQPFSLIPFLYHQQRKQGLLALYKGLSSELLVRGITFGAENAIINYTDWPKEISQRRLARDSLRLLAIRAISVAVSTSFLCAALKETIQSVIIVRDRPSFLDCLKDGFMRLIHFRSIPSARMLPIWLLIVPTVLYHVSHSVIRYATSGALDLLRSNLVPSRYRSRKVEHHTMMDRSMFGDPGWQTNELTYEETETSIGGNDIVTDSSQISNSIIANLVADITLLPLETILNCLYIQGTRTIVDNVDETTVVLPVLTNYGGFSECYQSILKFEGPIGLYKGLGAIFLQYSLHIIMFRLTYHVLKEFQDNQRAASPPRPRRPVRPVSNYKRYIDNNRHSTPTNPHEPPNHRLDSMLLHDTMIGSDRDTLNYGRFSNRMDLLPTIDDN